MSFPSTRTVRFALDVEGTGREDIEFDIEDDHIVGCIFNGNVLKSGGAYPKGDSSPFWMIVDLVGGEMAILSKEGDAKIDDFDASESARAV